MRLIFNIWTFLKQFKRGYNTEGKFDFLKYKEREMGRRMKISLCQDV